MTLSRAPIRAVLLLAACAALAQTTTLPPKDPAIPPDVAPAPKPKPRTPRPAQGEFNPNVVLLDPAHGGSDDGAHFANGLLEKEITVALANRLKPLLEARGFTVVLTHADATDDVPLDNRVEIANRSHAVACLILHASNGGHGVHVFMSSLNAADAPTDSEGSNTRAIQPWDLGQAPLLARSARLESDLATGLNGLRIPLLTEKVSVRPMDAMSCPAVALEIAPLEAGETHTSVADENYQQRVAESTAEALALWRSHAQAMALSAEIAHSAQAARQAAPAQSAGKPAAKPRPKPSTAFPEETPENGTGTQPPVRKPAPIVRRPAPSGAIAPPPPQEDLR